MTRAWLGVDKDSGVVLIGSQRGDFPTDIEKLLIRVAINQAVIELSRAQVADPQRHAAEMERDKLGIRDNDNELVGVLTQNDVERGLRLYQLVPRRAVHRVAHSW